MYARNRHYQQIATTVKLSVLMYLSAVLLKSFTLCCMKRDRVSADANTPNRFSILCNRDEAPWLSTRSASRTCSGTEQRSSVINRRLHSKKRRLILLIWYAGEAGSVTLEILIVLGKLQRPIVSGPFLQLTHLCLYCHDLLVKLCLWQARP